MPNAPGQPEDFEFPGEFIPAPSGQDCSKKAGGWGVPMTDFEYIWYGNKGEDDYPEEACDPYYHKAAQIDNFQVNTLLTSPAAEITTVTGNLIGNATTAKSIGGAFDAPHLTKPGKRVRHLIPEGPEAGIYVRGKLKDTNVIKLPDYWSEFIDPDSITVSLTQIGYSQDLIVDSIDWGKYVRVRSGSGASIHCFYEVWAARWLNPQDHNEKLHVVYDGESPDDYPGDNSRILIGGWDYDKRHPMTGERLDKDS